MEQVKLENLIGKTAHEIAASHETKDEVHEYARGVWRDAVMLYDMDAGASKSWVLVEHTANGSIWRYYTNTQYMWAWWSPTGIKHTQYLDLGNLKLEGTVSDLDVARLLATGYSHGAKLTEDKIRDSRRKNVAEILLKFQEAVTESNGVLEKAMKVVQSRIIQGDTEIITD